MEKSTYLLVFVAAAACVALRNSRADSRSPRLGDQNIMLADGQDVSLYGIKVGQTLHIDWPKNNDLGNCAIAIVSDTTSDEPGDVRYWAVTEVTHDYVVVDETVTLSAPEGQVFQKTIPRQSISVVTRVYKKSGQQQERVSDEEVNSSGYPSPVSQ